MTFEDAKKKAAEHGYWFRPVTWEGHGRAIADNDTDLSLQALAIQVLESVDLLLAREAERQTAHLPGAECRATGNADKDTIGERPYLTKIPTHYRCTECGVVHCKLWRQDGVSMEDVRLVCLRCACTERELPQNAVNEYGAYLNPLGQWTLFFTDLVPAIPVVPGSHLGHDMDAGTYWGFDHWPAAGLSWWRALPTLADLNK